MQGHTFTPPRDPLATYPPDRRGTRTSDPGAPLMSHNLVPPPGSLSLADSRAVTKHSAFKVGQASNRIGHCKPGPDPAAPSAPKRSPCSNNVMIPVECRQCIKTLLHTHSRPAATSEINTVFTRTEWKH